ncbi:MAG: hypothetical protein V1851_00790 [Patescibacteria group bacterium]
MDQKVFFKTAPLGTTFSVDGEQVILIGKKDIEEKLAIIYVSYDGKDILASPEEFVPIAGFEATETAEEIFDRLSLLEPSKQAIFFQLLGSNVKNLFNQLI